MRQLNIALHRFAHVSNKETRIKSKHKEMKYHLNIHCTSYNLINADFHSCITVCRQDIEILLLVEKTAHYKTIQIVAL